MSITTIKGGGSFTATNIKNINDNFTALGATTAGGTLTSAHILVGSGSNVAADVAVSGDATISNLGAVSIAAGITAHALPIAVAAGYAIARGITALDSSNPTPIATGLTTVTGFSVCLNRATAVSSGTAFVTYGTITA